MKNDKISWKSHWKVAKILRIIFSFLLNSQNWLKHLMDDLHFSYITIFIFLKKKNWRVLKTRLFFSCFQWGHYYYSESSNLSEFGTSFTLECNRNSHHMRGKNPPRWIMGPNCVWSKRSATMHVHVPPSPPITYIQCMEWWTASVAGPCSLYK